MEKVRAWFGQSSDRGWLRNKTEQSIHNQRLANSKKCKNWLVAKDRIEEKVQDNHRAKYGALFQN